MGAVGTVGELWRYPVKSMMGDRFDALEVGDNGVVGDRGWAVRDEVRGGIRGAKKIAALMQLHARYVTEPRPGEAVGAVEITIPTGERVTADAADPATSVANEAISAYLDHPVTLWPLQPATDLDHYRRGPPDSDDAMAELRAMFGRDAEEPLPTMEGLPLDVLVQYESPPGTYFDAHPIHLLTDRSLATLARLAADARVDVRRFRPNIVLHLDDDVDGDFPESTWIGRTATAGGVELDIVAPCPRCVMVTRPLADLPEDRTVLRRIVRDADQHLGVYATVRAAGRIATGDAVTLT